MKPRVLFIGDHSVLAQLKRDYDVIVHADLIAAKKDMEEEWFHLAIIQLRTADQDVDEARLRFCMNDLDGVPKIILGPGVLDPTFATIKSTLSLLEHSSPALTVIMESDDPTQMRNAISKALKLSFDDVVKVRDTVTRALERPGGTGTYPKISGLDFSFIASQLYPQNGSKWVGELEDLFKMLFIGCTTVQVERREYLPFQPGVFTTLWVTPASETVSEHYPLLVKCGRRAAIDAMYSKYEKIYFPLTQVRPARVVRTSHFAAISLPVSTEPRALKGFSDFYFDSEVTAIDASLAHLFETSNSWRSQFRYDGRSIGAYFLQRWHLHDKKQEFENILTALFNGQYARDIELKWEEEKKGRRRLLFYLRGGEQKFEDPLLFLYENTGVMDQIRPQQCITHGDFRGLNWCVDPDRKTWLEGHENMEWGPKMTDFANVESVIKFHALGRFPETKQLGNLFTLERVMLYPASFSEDLRLQDVDDGLNQIKKAITVIQLLRKRARPVSGDTELKEYYAHLFYFAMREIISDNYIPSKQSAEVRKIHALISAALIVYRLENWENWVGWDSSSRKGRK